MSYKVGTSVRLNPLTLCKESGILFTKTVKIFTMNDGYIMLSEFKLVYLSKLQRSLMLCIARFWIEFYVLLLFFYLEFLWNHCESGKWTDAEFQGSLTTRCSRIFLPITLEAKYGKIAKWSQHESQWGFRSLGGDFELCRQSNVHRCLAIGGHLYRVRELEPEQGTIQHATTRISQQIS